MPDKKNSLSRLTSLWAPVFVWCSVIFILSAIPSLKTELGIWDLILRKLAHITEYAVLYMLLFRAFSNTDKNRPVSYYVFLSIVLSVLYAGTDEFHQAFVPGRGPSVYDVGIDSVGVAVGALINFMRRKSAQKQKVYKEYVWI